MPTLQRGSIDKPRGSWRARWADEDGKRRQKWGFRTKAEASSWLAAELDRVHHVRRGDNQPLKPASLPTLDALVDEYLAQHTAEQNTIATLTYRLAHARSRFGTLRIDRLTVPELAAWRKQLSEGSAWHVHKALRQVLNYAVAAGYVERNVARDIPNPEPKRREVPFFDTPQELALVVAQLPPRFRGIPVFAADTGLRPEEWLALERRDLEIDRDTGAGVVTVRRVFTDGVVKPYGKQSGSLRTVAVTRAAVAALTARIDTPLLFPGDRGGYLDLHFWRGDYWTPAVKAAGLDVDQLGRKVKLTPYSLRHTFAAWQLAAGMDLYALAKRMGTSVDQIDKTYGHLRKGAIDSERAALERWQASVQADADESGRNEG